MMTFADRFYGMIKDEAFEYAINKEGTLDIQAFERKITELTDKKLNELHALVDKYKLGDKA
jgi:hypothetical protein